MITAVTSADGHALASAAADRNEAWSLDLWRPPGRSVRGVSAGRRFTWGG